MTHEPLATGSAALTATAIGALVTTLLGVDLRTLFWSLIGATIGISFAPPLASRWRAGTLFGAVVFACALLGQWLQGVPLPAIGRFPGAVAALLLALVFHPLLGAAVPLVGPVVRALVQRLFRVEVP